MTDTAGSSATDNMTSAVVTAVAVPSGEVMLRGAAAQYIIADDNGSLYIQDTVDGRDGIQVLPGVSKIAFADGLGIFDHTGAVENVARLYQGILGRAPDPAGVQAWASLIDNSNVPLSAVADAIASSPEFIHEYGSLSNAGFVNQLYENVLGRPADTGGAQAWGNLLASGTSRGSVAVGVAESAEAQAYTLPTAGDTTNAAVYRLYEAAFGRTPDSTGRRPGVRC